MDEIVALGQLETSSMRCSASRRNGPDARYRVRIHFDNLLRLAHAARPLRRRAWAMPAASRRHGYSSPTSGPITISSAVISTTQTALITSPGGSMSNIR